MSLTSYRTAPPRGTCVSPQATVWPWPQAEPIGTVSMTKAKDAKKGLPWTGWPSDLRMGFYRAPPATMPGDDLLSQRLSASTIGAARFHGRVRDGIGWVTGAKVTKQ